MIIISSSIKSKSHSFHVYCNTLMLIRRLLRTLYELIDIIIVRNFQSTTQFYFYFTIYFMCCILLLLYVCLILCFAMNECETKNISHFGWFVHVIVQEREKGVLWFLCSQMETFNARAFGHSITLSKLVPQWMVQVSGDEGICNQTKWKASIVQTHVNTYTITCTLTLVIWHSFSMDLFHFR